MQAVGEPEIDVERHEYYVLKGAKGLLKEGLVRDIVFEDVSLGDSRTKDLLLSYGYDIFSIEYNLKGPYLVPFRTHGYSLEGIESNYSDFLATLIPSRAITRFVRKGFRCLRPFKFGD